MEGAYPQCRKRLRALLYSGQPLTLHKLHDGSHQMEVLKFRLGHDHGLCAVKYPIWF